MAERQFLTVEEFGAEIGVGRKRANELIHTSSIPHIRLGRRIYVPRRALDALADQAFADQAFARAREGVLAR